MESSPLSIKELSTLFALLLLGQVDAQILSPLLPEIASTFGVSPGKVGTSVGGYSLAAATAALVIGPLSDRRGRRGFLLLAAAIFALASGVVLWSSTFTTFAVARTVAGAAGGVTSALVVALIADRVRHERRGSAMAWVAGAYSIAPVLGVPAGAWLDEARGWKSIYLLFLVFALAILAALAAWLHSPSAGLESSGERRVLSRYLGFLKDRRTAIGAWSAFFVSGGITGFTTYLGAYLHAQFGLTVASTKYVFLLCGGASVVGAFGSGRLSDRVGKRTLAVAGSLALAVTLAGVPYLPYGVPLYFVLTLVGLAAFSRVAPLQSLVTELVPKEARGAYVALRNTFSQLGIAAAATIGAALYNHGGFALVCYFTTALNLVAAGLLLLLEEPSAETVRGEPGMAS